jgi:predicted phage tail protein
MEELSPTPTAAQSTPAPSLTPAQFGKLSHRIDSIESANLPGATVGAKLIYEDSPQLHSASGRPVRLTYAVVTEGVEGRSDLSNLAVITPLDVAVPPANLAATPKAEGVALTWTAPAKSVTGDTKPAIAGYNIYRVAKGQSIDTFALPVNPSPVTRTDYTDAPPYGTYEYSVSAVASAGPPRIESDRSTSVEATFKDLVPPPPPPSVTALVETKVVRLVWEGVDAPDLAGYFVYRTEKAGRIKFQTGKPINQTFFGDESILPGIEYYYSVTAVDKSGNESAETKSQTVMVPKTP